MFIRDLSECKEIIAGDRSILRELFNPLKDDLNLRYSLAHSTIKSGQTTKNHKLKVSEIYYIIQGRGMMYVEDESREVKKGQVVYIPPNHSQKITNTGEEDLIFLCIVDPAWKPDYEEIF